jgi:aquaglyceroporin related protein
MPEICQQDASSPASRRTHSRNDQRGDPYTLAGPQQHLTESPSTTGREQTSLRSQRTRSNAEVPGESTSHPIWGLAGPLPRIHRSRKQSRNESPHINLDFLKPNRSTHDSVASHHESEQAEQPAAPTGFGPAPQIDVTPSRHDDERQERQAGTSTESRSSLEPGDLLRRATTAGVSTYHPGAVARPGSLLSGHTFSTMARRARHKLHREHVSAHDQAISPATSSTERAASSDIQMSGLPLEKQPTDSDFALEKTAGFAGDTVFRSGSESEVESARCRMQAFADTADTDSMTQQVPANIDWEEYQPQEQSLESQSSRRSIHQPRFYNFWGVIRHRFRQPFAEWLGTVVFMTIGLSGSVVHTTAQNAYENILAAYLTWGLGVMIGIYIAGGVSGAHLNPTLSIVLSIFRGFPWSLCWQYVVAQLLGTITASGIVYGLYKDAITEYAAADIVRAGPAFYTQPRDGLSDTAAFFTEFVATAIASGSVLALGDEANAPPGAGMHAFIIGLLITSLCMAFSYNTGTCLNPARDLGPRLIVWAAGFGSEVMTLRSYWFIWGPWCGTISGGIFGAAVYDTFIFVGGESPINYPTGSLRHHLSWGEIRGKSRMGRGKDKEKDINDVIDGMA